MIRIVFCFLIFNLIVACNNKNTVPTTPKITNRQNVMIGFGKAKLGMTVQEFEKTFHKKLTLKSSDKINCFVAMTDSLKIGEEIFLETARLEFNDNKLFSVSTSENPLLFDYLKRNFGIINQEEHGYGFIGLFETNSDSIFCSYEYVNGSSNIGIYKLLNFKK